MKSWIPCLIVLGMLWPPATVAQDDDQSLGALARDLRRNKPPQQLDVPLIDNENLAQATEEAKNRRARETDKDKLVLSIDSATQTIKASAQDVTCSLSFNGRSGALLVNPVAIEKLPLPELLKLDGPASIQDENLQLEVFNGTEWDLREITVGLTLERQPGTNAEVAARGRVVPAAENSLTPTIEKRSDVTLLYHLKAEAKPFSTTTFKEDIGITPGPDEDWRWSIVEAKGVRPKEVQLPPEWTTPIPAPDTTVGLPTPLAPGAVTPSKQEQGISPRP